MNTRARSFAAFIALIGAASLGLQTYVSSELFLAAGGNVADAIWRLVGYFTILTNVLVFVVMASVAVGVRILPAKTSFVLGGVTLFISVVGLIYHVLLSELADPRGWAEVADIGLHYVVPILTVVFWIAFAPKADLVFRDAAVWLLYPLAYCAYALVRGAATHWYPYPFIDVATLGLSRALLNAVMLSVGFLALGCGLIYIGRWLDSRN